MTIHGWLLLATPPKGPQWEWSCRWQIDCSSGVDRHLVILAIVSDAHDLYLGYTRLNVAAQRTIFEDEAPRVGNILIIYVGVRRDTFLDVYSRSERRV